MDTMGSGHDESVFLVGNQLFRVRPPLGATRLFSLASSTFGSVGQAVTVSDVDTVRSASTRWLAGSVSLCCGPLTWELVVHVPFEVALDMLAAVRQVKTDELSESQVSVVPGDLARQWGAHLRDPPRHPAAFERTTDRGRRVRSSEGAGHS
jgi:hypothetical protein